MLSHSNLAQRSTALEAELAALKEAGDYLIGVRIERSPAGGSASKAAKEECKYARLRAGRGKLLPNGKKSLYIPVAQIAHYEAACDRGKQVQQLERQIECLKTQIWKLEQSQYRHWDDKSRKPRRHRKLALPVAHQPSAIIEVEPPLLASAPAAILVLYRQADDTPVHAVAAEVWQGEQKIIEVKPVHCMGMRADRVADYIKTLLSDLHQRFAVTRFEDVIKEMPVQQCPIPSCPLKNDR
ncbi:hypothetical protein [Stenomitos frigidus]|uniref:Uncharacterized protein n=1 Tax=Stenomitos frigidus ULC18 TaxID=2107698 RepID=A0A2T1EH78_9CYAN|nr:hypothetical protein [Stenomitos frigidus]PSB32064.1 hypothetical protein C7B82_06220 [Stenomitos frigidus ULC18]